MNKYTPFIIIFLALMLVALTTFFTKKSPPTEQKSIVNSVPKEISISLTDQGFQPNTIEIKPGTAVRFSNNSSNDKASVNSDDYPENKKFPELNLGVFQKGSTLTHIFKSPNTYTYHDQFNPEHTGTIIVVE